MILIINNDNIVYFTISLQISNYNVQNFNLKSTKTNFQVHSNNLKFDVSALMHLKRLNKVL